MLPLIAACSILLSGHAAAQSAPAPMAMPLDTRLVVFRYDPNVSYPILTRPGAVTHIALEPDETVQAFALGDTVQWIVQDKGPHLFVKPTRADLFTSGTLVTTRRTYQLALRSSPPNGQWYQRVSWSVPDLLPIVRDGGAPAPGNGAAATAAAPAVSALQAGVAASRLPAVTAATGAATGPGATGPAGASAAAAPGGASGVASAASRERRLDPVQLHFDYTIRGNAPFRPVRVLDDARFTYIQLPASMPEMPALFVLGETGEGELVNYTLRGDFLVVQRVAEQFVLRLGRAEVVITREAARTAGVSPSFDGGIWR